MIRLEPRKLKLLYGVHGYGRGHAVRAEAVLPQLTRKYDTHILAGDEAYDLLGKRWAVTRIPTLRYYHHEHPRRRSARKTIKRNISALLDLMMRGPIFQMVQDEIRRFDPDVVISDSEGWTHWAARALGVPHISFDHYGIMVYCRLEMPLWDRAICGLESMIYRMLVCKPERIIVTAFYPGRPRRDEVCVVGPILRQEVQETRPVSGDYLLAYFSNAAINFTPAIERSLCDLDCPVKVYGPPRDGVEGNLEFCPTASLPFVRDLAGSRAVFATAGNQLISEAIHFGKPLLVIPEDSLEQRLNARFVDNWQIGMQTTKDKVTAGLLRSFLDRAGEFARNISARRSESVPCALGAIEEAVAEIASRC
jgi:uncharacterized protein (TIGR00661 family)